jgi:flagella basal body P-ring formation protein FlgA
MLCVLLVADPVRGAATVGQTISEKQFQSLFFDYVCEKSGRSPEDVVVSRFRISGNKSIPAGGVRLRVDQPRQGELKGFVRLNVLVEVDGAVRNRVSLSGWVDTYQRVVFAGSDLKRGQRIERGDLYMDRVNIARMSSNTAIDIESIVGHQCKHHIRSGTAIKTWMLERVPVVSKGDLVTILAESAGVRLTVPGRVMETGFKDEPVAVENIMSQKKVYATVVDGSTVTVDF